METATAITIIVHVIGWGLVGVFTFWGITDADDKALHGHTEGRWRANKASRNHN